MIIIGYTENMETTHSETFFFISSIGFVILGILASIIAAYIIYISRSFLRILNKIEDGIDNISDTTKDLVDDMREHVFYKMLFPSKRKKTILKKESH